MTTSVLSQTSNQVSSASKAVLNTLLYFDIFNHPLTRSEIHQYLHRKIEPAAEISLSIKRLVEKGLIKEEGDFLYISDNGSQIISKRKKGEEYSEKGIKTAKKYSKLIAKFPFVRGVFISGSLSKGYMDETSDIDYFIVTAPNRLWICRTLLILFKKLFLFNSRKNFCLNYFVTSDHLVIPDKNIFTATELVSVIPTYNYPLYRNYLEANSWTHEYLPNICHRTDEYCVYPSTAIFKKTVERLLKERPGAVFDKLCYDVTLKFWKKKFSNFKEADFNNRFRSSKDVSKHHPLGYQFKVLDLFSDKVKTFELRNNIKLL